MVNIRPISAELQKKAIEELNEDPGRIEKDIEAFKEWIKKSPHIKGRTDDQFLIAFLRGCKFSLERAKQKYDLFYTLKTHMPQVFQNRDPTSEKNQKILLNSVGILLPKSKTPGAPRYFLARPNSINPDETTADSIMKEITFIYETLMIEDDDFIISGLMVAGDHKGVTLRQISIFNSSVTIKKIATLIQDGYPVRQKGMHFFNMPSLMVTLFNLFKSFLNEKVKSRIQVHGNDLEELTKIIPKEVLPKEYGGDAGTIKQIQEYNLKMVMTHRDYFLEDDQYRVDEIKRVGKPKSQETLFGVDGTFRQLQID